MKLICLLALTVKLGSMKTCMKYTCGKPSPAYNLTRSCLTQTSSLTAEFTPNTCDSKQLKF